MQFATSDETCKYVRSQTSKVILGFSGGKDSILAWAQLRRFWHAKDIIPICQLFVPGPPEQQGKGTLPYLQKALDDYEQQIGRRIYRVPHMSFYASMAGKVWQPPERYSTLEHLNEQGYFPLFDYHDYNTWIKEQTGLEHAWVATGIKQADNIYRRRHISQHGSVLPQRQTFYPVWDFTKQMTVDTLKMTGLKLSVDYEWFGRSLAGIDARFTWALKDKSPEDYRVLKFWYPLCDLDHFRMVARSRLLAAGAASRKAVIMDDTDDRFLGLDGVETSLQQGVAEIAAAIQQGGVSAKTTNMFDNLDTKFYTVFAFQSEAAKLEVLTKLKLLGLGDKYICGEEAARILGVEVETPVPGKPNWKIDPVYKDLIK